MLEYAIISLLNEICGPIIGTDRIYPSFTTEIPGITYIDTPISSGLVKEDQVEIKIIHDDIDEALLVKKAISDKLNTKYQDKSLVSNNISLRGSLSGGGQLFNDSIQVWELSLIFIIMWRRLNNE